jgi:ABC-type sugar transport system ATPase subunit/ribose/xylose/arabinose/galactoside ABC-type transport system permease subunit
MPPPRLRMTSLTKSYGGVQALAGVDFEVAPGQIHGLVGENGAGKSTLIKIAAGTVQPDSATIEIDGEPISIRHPQHARAAGIAVVHQEAERFANLSVAENMLLGRGLPTVFGGVINWPETYRRAENAIHAFGEDIPVRSPAGSLSVARRMLAEIAAAVDQNARVLFLDEPTAALTKRESQRLFEQIQRLAASGVAIVYVSHRLEEIKTLCDRVTVLRDGEHVITTEADQLSLPQIVAHMVGRQVDQIFPKTSTPRDEPALRLDGLSDATGRFHDVSLTVHRGEVVGLYGLVGAGRTELAEAIFGIRPIASGRIELDGAEIRPSHPAQAMRLGIAYLPEDRLVHGVFSRLSVHLNGVMAVLRRWSRLGFSDQAANTERANRVFDTLRVKLASADQPIRSLSGGNQQKVVFSRWLLAEPSVLLLDEPTRGIDVNAKAELHKLIDDLARAGKSILLISSELPEAMGMSDRLIVLREGRIVGDFDPKTTDEIKIAAAALPAVADRESSRRAQRSAGAWTHRIRQASLFAALALLAVALGIAEPGKFANMANAQDVASAAAVPFFVALGATVVIASGGIDISVGSILALCAAVCGMAVNAGSPVLVAVGLAIGVGAALGTLNAAASLLGHIHPIVVTLATLGIYRGLMRVVTKERRIQDFPETFRALTEGWWLGVRPLIWYAVAAVLLGTVFLRYTRTGRSILAVGDSPTAAQIIGLSKTKLQLLAFAISGGLTGLAGAFWASSYNIVDTYTAEGFELKAIAAAVVGGCAITGGTGTAWGAAIGALLLELIRNGLILLKSPSEWEGFFVGALILLVVIIDARLKGRAT